MKTTSTYHISIQSANKKVGPLPVTTSPPETCPKNCPLKDTSCYANYGPLKIHWNKTHLGLRGSNWEGFLDQISRLPRKQLWRHNQAGDLRGDGLAINSTHVDELIKANKDKRGFTYTHYSLTDKTIKNNITIGEWNAQIIRRANARGFTINISSDSIKEADELVKLKTGPVVTILPSTTKNKSFTSPAGNKVVVCPAALDNPRLSSCAKCGLCARSERDFIIGFPSHGTKKKVLDIYLTKGD